MSLLICASATVIATQLVFEIQRNETSRRQHGKLYTSLFQGRMQRDKGQKTGAERMSLITF